jgi:hypothetical protein
MTRGRPWWKWAAIALLLTATLTVTAVYAATLAIDIGGQHWAKALDASREAVLVVVGWAAVIIVLSAGADRKAARPEPMRPGDTGTADELADESAAKADSVVLAQERVRRQRARLAELAAVRERAGSGADPDLDREVASAVARLEQARQWLTSAQSARTASRSDHPPDDARPGNRGQPPADAAASRGGAGVTAARTYPRTAGSARPARQR